MRQEACRVQQAGTRQGAHRRAPARQLPQVVWLYADLCIPPQPDSKGGFLGSAARRHRQPSHKSSSRPCWAQHETKAGNLSHVAALGLLKPPGSDKPSYGNFIGLPGPQRRSSVTLGTRQSRCLRASPAPAAAAPASRPQPPPPRIGPAWHDRCSSPYRRPFLLPADRSETATAPP